MFFNRIWEWLSRDLWGFRKWHYTGQTRWVVERQLGDIDLLVQQGLFLHLYSRKGRTTWKKIERKLVSRNERMEKYGDRPLNNEEAASLDGREAPAD